MKDYNYEQLLELDHSQLLSEFDEIRYIKEISIIITRFVKDEISREEFSALLIDKDVAEEKIIEVLGIL